MEMDSIKMERIIPLSLMWRRWELSVYILTSDFDFKGFLKLNKAESKVAVSLCS